MTGQIKRALPWQAKLALKVLASRINALRRIARRLGAFDHGPMGDPVYVRHWIDIHTERTLDRSVQGCDVLELGPGDSIASAIVLADRGVASTTLIDAEAFATEDLSLYRALAAQLAGADLQAAVNDAQTFEGLTRATRSTYRVGGLDALRTIATDSIDASWSQAVLEHVRADEFDELIRELRRVHRVGTRTSHRIDLMDHLDRGLNHLRFPRRIWESSLLRRADFYTNRLRAPQIIEAFERAGFSVEVVASRRWDRLPIPRRALHTEFRALSDDALLIWEIDIVATALRASAPGQHGAHRAPDHSSVEEK